MGNESSKLKGLIIDKNAVEVNDFWALYNAESPTTSNEDGRQLLSIFQGEGVVKGQLWVNQGPLERAIKNLRIYRHPYIVKYVTTWDEGGQKHLATEQVRPLNDILAQQSDIQVCLGIRTILCSLIFLIEKAMARHLNICTQSIYVTENGSWRLAGFEYVWKAKEVNTQLLDLARSFLYQAALDATNKEQIDAIEQFAFATLCEEILEKYSKSNCSTPHIEEFRAYCGTHLKHKNSQLRPKLSAVLLHPYFNHEFVLIHSFLFELPLKSVQEKQQFFTSLIDRLRYFNEQVVASQLAKSLFSRMVLLDPNAQLCVTPYVLRTKSEQTSALFTQKTYKEYLLPEILKMFRLRDAQIRLILLEYFMEYVRLLDEEQLQEDILPHLLAGMNDTNDVLVAKTLRCLADLVPILGAATVIGGQRLRLFSDGRPQAAVSADSSSHWVEPRSITPVMNGSDAIDDFMVSGSPLPPAERELSGSYNSLLQLDEEHLNTLPLRLSPDGGEDDKTKIIADTLNGLDNVVADEPTTSTSAGAFVAENMFNSAAEDEVWSDWENTDADKNETDTNREILTPTANDIDLLTAKSTSSSFATLPTQHSSSRSDSYRTSQSNASSTAHSTKAISTNNSNKKIIDDLSAFDIQVQVTTPATDTASEFDFFKDMVPVIQATNIATTTTTENMTLAATTKTTTVAAIDDEVKIDASRFAAQHSTIVDDDIEAHDGWGVDELVDDVAIITI